MEYKGFELMVAEARRRQLERRVDAMQTTQWWLVASAVVGWGLFASWAILVLVGGIAGVIAELL